MLRAESYGDESVSNKKCVLIVGMPMSGGSLIGKILLQLGYSASGTDKDPSKDWNLMSVNHVMCDLPQKPKMNLSSARYAVDHIEAYIKNKIEENTPWIMHDPLLCMTFCEFIPFLEKHGITYKVIIPTRHPHHSALDMLREDKSKKLEEVSALLGRYIIARSMNTERFFVMGIESGKSNEPNMIHLSINDVIDKTEETIDALISQLELEVTPEQKKAAGLLVSLGTHV
jgi:hypothetical protein